MAIVDLADEARRLAVPWRSHILGKTGNACIKVLRMDASSHIEEAHPYDEVLLVLEGSLELRIDGMRMSIRTGEMLVVKAGQTHAVLEGSNGILIIVDSA